MERRSIRRQRKAVNYSQICEDDDSEDDFAPRPPTKRIRGEKKGTTTQTQKEVVRSRLPETATDVDTKGRLSRDEKLFNRELQQALEVSKVTCHQTSNQLPLDIPAIKKDGDSDFSPDGEEDSASNHSEGLDSKPQPKTKTKRKRAGSDSATRTTGKRASATTTVTLCQVNTAQGSVSTPKQTVCSGVTLRPEATTIPASIGPRRMPEATSKPTTPASIGPRRMPKWTPPARVSPGSENVPFSPSVTSCGMPVIRVGLSRNARVKPLHTRPGS